MYTKRKEMKRYNHYIVWLSVLALTFTACDKIEPEFFDEDYNGAYFDYADTKSFETTLNFGEYIVGNPQEIPVVLNVKLLGYLQDEARTLSIKTKEVEDYPLAEVIIPNVVFENKEYQKGVEILVKRPEVENEVFAVCIYLDGKGDLDTGVAGKNEYFIYVKEVHEQPTWWGEKIKEHLGAWDREKHAFFANIMNDDYYYNSFFRDEEKKELEGGSLIELNVKAVNTLLAEEPSEPITINIPMLGESQKPVYDEPFFWSRYSNYLGFYSSERFYNLNRVISATNTTNIIDAYNSENALANMEKYKTDYHKIDVLAMLDAYYKFPKQGYTIDQYKELIWVKMDRAIEYVGNDIYVRIPYWWEDPDNLGTGEIIKKCFGEYNDAKYHFMIMALIEEAEKNGLENDFVVASMLPFAIDGDSWGWDETVRGVKEAVGGLATLKECHEIITAKKQATVLHKIPKEVDWDMIAKENN